MNHTCVNCGCTIDKATYEKQDEKVFSRYTFVNSSGFLEDSVPEEKYFCNYNCYAEFICRGKRSRMENESMTLTREVLEKYKQDVFIETGTWDGRTVQMALDSGYSEVISIETDLSLYNQAVSRFEGNDAVKLIYGDSLQFLPWILQSLDKVPQFWLDAHVQENYAYGTVKVPILHELDKIAESVNPVVRAGTIMIDDMRCVGKAYGWENITFDMIISRLLRINPAYTIVREDSKAAKDDILVAYVPEKFSYGFVDMTRAINLHDGVPVA